MIRHTAAYPSRHLVAGVIASLALALLAVLDVAAAPPADAVEPPNCDGLVASKVGTAKKDAVVGTAGADVVVALGGPDDVRGLAGDDALCGDDGNDAVLGGDGDDVLLGGAGNDALQGGTGDDVLYSGAGVNAITGADGADTVYALNGKPDTIACGSGADVVSADFFDAVKKDCEQVARRLVNRAPGAPVLSATSIAENELAGTTVGTLSATDVDTPETHAFRLVPGDSDTDNASFSIDGSALKTAASFDFEDRTSYSVRVRVTDSAGATSETSFTIAVTDVNEAPTDLALNAAAIEENQDAGTAIGTLSASDPDAGDTLVFTLVPGEADNTEFTIDGTTLKSGTVFDFETDASYSVVVRVTDTGGRTDEETFTISVADGDDTPVVVDPTAVADSATVNRYSTANTINVLTNDTNPSGDPVSITAVTQPSHGSVTIAADGQSVGYVPVTGYCNSDASGDLDADTFTYTLNGGSTATVSVKVVASDEPPTITGLTRTRGNSAPVPITMYTNAGANSLANSLPIVINASESLDPAACGSGTLSFQWVISYPGLDIYRVAGITGYRTSTLNIAANSLLPVASPPGATLTVSATSNMSGKTTELGFNVFVTQTTLTFDMYNECQAELPTCTHPQAGPAGPD